MEDLSCSGCLASSLNFLFMEIEKDNGILCIYYECKMRSLAASLGETGKADVAI